MLTGRYEIIRRLGGGGFAITFLARDRLQPSQPLCVVKQLRPNQTHPRVVEFFEAEAAILEKLGKHPQIPQLLAHFREDDNLYIVQEFIEGQDLSEEIFAGQKLGESYTTELLQDVLEVLSFVHSQGVIHRDIKPQNLMRRSKDGKIFLIDFGAVKELASLVVNAFGEVTPSVILGTPGYMASEQNNGKPNLSSDVYAVGMTAIQALTGILPVDLQENPKTGEVIWRSKTKVNDHLAKVLTKMVRRHHSLRYSQAAEALQALTGEMPTTPLKLPQPTNWSRRRMIQTFGLVGAGFVTAVVGQQLLSANSRQKTNSPLTSITPINETPESPISETPVPTAQSTNTRKLSLQTFQFEVVTVNVQGKIITRRLTQANFFIENLGNGIVLEMVEIPSGQFLMGSPPEEKDRNSDEEPQHTVTIKPFYMGKFVVTQEQYQVVMGTNPSYFKGSKRPVEKVSGNAAIAFCEKLSLITGKTYRLPSEAEWEYACRAGTTTPFHFGETITTELGNFLGEYAYGAAPVGEYRQQTTDVGSFPANAFGLCDMHGNVLEWCQDGYQNNYNEAANDGSPRVNDNNSPGVLRGGSWLNNPSSCRSAARIDSPIDEEEYDYGFRVVYSVAAAN
ncbi:MAG: SUMF1/EgtB/PvdO family nonheme iron enzyme [Desmonostoc vinosum HA7617-LM4]|nr:SUMF1/EgtB/PvdO family nonheme iron enzyme [Desmonostoc vinosum HA7617-LM4]